MNELFFFPTGFHILRDLENLHNLYVSQFHHVGNDVTDYNSSGGVTKSYIREEL